MNKRENPGAKQAEVELNALLQDDEVIREFLIESNENLNRLDTEIVDLERNPTTERLASIFRTIHTIKGTCGFLGFQTLECITHHAENILSQLRSGQRKVTAPMVSLVLETVDAVRQILASIESSGGESTEKYPILVQRLEEAAGDIHNDPPAPAHSKSKAVTDFPPAQDGEKSLSVGDTTIRVDVSLLDKLMNLVGELVLARNQIMRFNTQKDDSVLNAISQRLNLITTELQESVMKTRMQPIGVVWNKLPRVVRDVAHSLGKQIKLEMEGADTELDRTIIEAIKDPLTHLVRNSCDHGIEDPQERVRIGKPGQWHSETQGVPRGRPGKC